MNLFTSSRERRLWTWTLLVVAAIYSTLGLAGTLVEALADHRKLIDNASILGFLLLLVAMFTLRVRTWPGWAELGVWSGIAGVYYLVIIRMAIPAAERTHLFEYTVVAALIYEALTERRSQGRRVPVPAILALVSTVLIGSLDEGIQALIPNRVFDPVDIGFNALAALMAVTAGASLAWVRRRREKGRLDNSGSGYTQVR